MQKKMILIFLFVIPLSFTFAVSYKGDDFLGYWKMKDGNFILKIERNIDSIYEGHVVWLKNPMFPVGDRDEGKIQSDRNNPDPTLRDRPVLGLKIVGDLKLNDEKLEDGWVYDSWNGNIYYGSAKVKNKNILQLKGSIDKFGIIGHTMKAYRVTKDDYTKYGIE